MLEVFLSRSSSNICTFLNGHELSQGSTAVQPIVIAAGLGAEGSEMLSSVLAAAPPEQQKQILGERLYPLVGHHQVKIFSHIPFCFLFI